MVSPLKFRKLQSFTAPSPTPPSLLFPSSSLLPKYENCKSALFISINPWQYAPQGRGSHGNPANSCLKNPLRLMHSVCLMHLKVLGGRVVGVGGGGRRTCFSGSLWGLGGRQWRVGRA